ncbi:MAG: class I SAM-dependent methyltransferase [Elusimicrobia bacterium]|nr:class I SAM-dependent methyltransferase [Elusimicrobiota bacterium]
MTGCAGCGKSAAEAFPARGIPAPHAFRVVRCLSCGLGWTDPPLAESQLGAWYPPSYYGDGNVRFNPLFERLVRVLRGRRARVIRRQAPKGAVLDVGCGRGFLLDSLRSLGYEPHGVELSEHAAWHASSRLGIPVHVGTLATAPHAAGSLSAVVLWHVLEHLARPFEALEKARELLRPGGLLILAVPNSESLQARLTGADWFHLDVPRHYWHFGARSLRAAVERAGFDVVREDHFSFEQNPYGWIQSLLNGVSPRFNLLYDSLKSRSARLPAPRPGAAAVAASLAAAALLFPLSFVLSVVEAGLRRGGTVEVYARKR